MQYKEAANFGRGYKQYELTNHLGNVLVTISDRKFAVSSTSNSSLIDHYEPVILTAQDYYPFGMISRVALPNNGQTYRFGFNGQEMNNEVKGLGNSYTAMFWEYDSRIGRRWNLDPKPTPGISEYSVFNNNPIRFSDLLGDTSKLGTRLMGALKMVGGLSEMGVGAVGGTATSWTGVGAVAGGAAVLHGADVTSSGFMQMWTGEETPSFTQKGISKGLQAVGVSQSTANNVAGAADMTLSMALSAGTTAATRDATSVQLTIPKIKIPKPRIDVPQVGEEIGLGLSEHLDDFTKAIGVKSYKTFTSGGFKPKEILAAIENTSNKIHFNLQDFTRWKYLKYADNPVDPSPALRNVTNWELYKIYNTPGALERTTFYKYIDGVYTAVPKPF
jgi:RHS repeat-associated protein